MQREEVRQKLQYLGALLNDKFLGCSLNAALIQSVAAEANVYLEGCVNPYLSPEKQICAVVENSGRGAFEVGTWPPPPNTLKLSFYYKNPTVINFGEFNANR